MYKPTPLCNLAMKYGADKCPQIGHMYTPFYYELFKDRKDKIKKVLEVGIGNNRQIKYIPGAYIGASIRMWRDFFPIAMVYGADVAPESFFEDERIKTFYCDEMDRGDIKKLIEFTGTDLDIVIDDACHHVGNQKHLLENMFPLLNPGVTYVVEDCRRTRQMRRDYPQWKSWIPKLPANEDPMSHDGIVVFTK